jgi:2'-5' RNA ligase
MRLFIAVDLPEEVREVLRDELGPLKRDQPPARWVRPEGMHITLKFLGEQPQDLVENLDAEVAGALSGLSPVTIRLGGGGYFPHDRRPRVDRWPGSRARCVGARH